ncbi:MAG: hypothetical protein QM775_08740 [Pirellulales bacterium]
MKASFGQVYIEPGVNLPFSHHFQHKMSSCVTSHIKASKKFADICGVGGRLGFNVSAKRNINSFYVHGPTVFKKTNDIEFTVFLPFDVIVASSKAPKVAVTQLFDAIYKVLDGLEIDTMSLREHANEIIDDICSDSSMLAEPSWDKIQNDTQIRKQFTTFYVGHQT